MVRRVFHALYREVRGLHEAAYVLALFAVGSQLLALIRDRLMAHQFGAGMTLDIYYAAFRIPDLLFAVFTSILSVYVLIPFLADRMLEGTGKARDFMSTILTWFLIGYGVLALGVVLCAPLLVRLSFPGFGPAEQDMLVLTMRILLLQPLFLSLSSLFGVVTQLHRKFVLYALSPLLYNVGIIIGIVVFYPYMGLAGLALGVVLGSLFHMMVQIPFLFHSGVAPRLSLRPEGALLKKILLSSLPRAVTLMLQQFVLLALTAVATLMATGSVAVLQFAYNLQSVPLTIIGVSYSVAAFPTFARLYASGNHKAFLEHVYAAFRHILFWSIPATALFVVIRAQLVRVILGSGAFDWNDTRLTAAVLALFIISLVAQSVHNLFIRAFYAGGNSKTPLVVTTLSSISIIIVSFVLYVLYQDIPAFAQVLRALFRVSDVPGTEVLILPLAFSVVFIVHSIVLVYLFARAYGTGGVTHIKRSFWHSLGASGVIALVTYGALNVLVGGFRVETFVGVFLQGFVAGMLGIVAGVLFLWSVKSRELREIRIALQHRFWKVRPIVPQEKP